MSFVFESEETMPKNTDPLQPWNDPIFKDDRLAPHNDPLRRDDLLEAWNDPIGTAEDLSDADKDYYFA